MTLVEKRTAGMMLLLCFLTMHSWEEMKRVQGFESPLPPVPSSSSSSSSPSSTPLPPLRTTLINPSARPRRPLDRKAMLGLWRLTPRHLPMKEFTVYPKPSRQQQQQQEQREILLVLKDDGSFQPFFSDPKDEEALEDEEEETRQPNQHDADDSWRRFVQQQQQPRSAVHDLQELLPGGRWDYREGKLLLAADRPKDTINPSTDETTRTAALRAVSPSPRGNSMNTQNPRRTDTLFIGRVVASYPEDHHHHRSPALPALTPNPMPDSPPSTAETLTKAELARDSSSLLSVPPTSAVTSDSSSTSLPPRVHRLKNVHLSVPMGSVELGKFVYPRSHPSFFDQPMMFFKTTMSSQLFSLQQVLRDDQAARSSSTSSSSSSWWSASSDDEKPVEKFRRSDFYNKTFWLTTHPIGQRYPSGPVRWSIKYNQYVHDPPSKAAAQAAAEEASQPVANIRVLQVQFHANNTFSTTAGLGSSLILRGKFDLVGPDRDQLWMQIWRFGFGRSVSGSVYSEGRMLTQDDAKTYWGTIQYQGTSSDPQHRPASSVETTNPESQGSSDQMSPSRRAEPPFSTQGAPMIDEGSGDNDQVVSPVMGNEPQVKQPLLEVKGSVMFGWGLEPLPVARFMMREMTEEELLEWSKDQQEDDDEEEEVEKEDDDDEERRLGQSLQNPAAEGMNLDQGIDWASEGDSSSFQ